MAKTARSFHYHQRTPDDIKRRANDRGGDFDDYIKPQFKKYKVRDGKNLIRILPPTWKEPNHYGYEVHINYGIGADNQSYLSLSKMKNIKDPLAEAKREAESEANEKVAKALRPNKRILVWLIDRQAEDEGPQLWAMPRTFDQALANISMDEDTKDVMYIDDPKKGSDVRFYKEGSGMLTKYDPSKMRLLGESRLSEDDNLEDEWLQFVDENPLPNVLQFYDYDHIAEVFNGNVRTNDDDEETAATVRNRPKPVAAKAPADDDEAKPARRRVVDDEDEEPAPRRTRAKVQAEPEDEEDPEDEEPPAAGLSIRERLRRSREGKKATVEADDD